MYIYIYIYIHTHTYQMQRWSHTNRQDFEKICFILFFMQSEIGLKEIHEIFLF